MPRRRRHAGSADRPTGYGPRHARALPRPPRPVPPMTAARFYDGRRAAPHPASAELTDAALVLHDGDGAILAEWPLDSLRGRHDTTAADDLLVWQPGRPARALIAAPALKADLRARCPKLTRPVTDPRLVRRATAFGLATLAAIGLMIFVLLPVLANRLAPLIPPDREAAFGRAVVVQVAQIFGVEDPEQPFCEDPRGAAALGTLVARLTDGVAFPYPTLTVQVVDSEIVNAFAAPGGQVVLFRGLIDAARSPDEVAGVLAHEFGHVAARDPTRLALRAAGTAGLLGLLFGDFTGSAVILTLGNRLIQAGYTREAEAQADLYALAMLERARISPGGLADFFRRLFDETGEVPGLAAMLQTHPDLGQRAAAARGAARWPTEPAMTPAEWRALRTICR